MQKLPEFYINYVSVGKRGIAETKMYKTCPFKVIYNSLERQRIGQRVDIKILSDKRYMLKINGGRNFEDKLSFGTRFDTMGFDFIVDIRDSDKFRYDPNNSNKYYFSFIRPCNTCQQLPRQAYSFPH